MTSNQNPEEDLRRREQELKERELSVRLRELESEVYGRSEGSSSAAQEVEVVTDVPLPSHPSSAPSAKLSMSVNS